MKLLLLLTFSIISISVFAQKKSTLQSHFTGRWQTASSPNVSGEYWMKKNDSTWAGTGYYIKGTDTVITETVELKANGKDIFYIPTAKGQNNELPVQFRMTSFSKGIFIFENPAHDFPKQIVYDFSVKGKVHAYVDGGGKPIHFYYFRVK